MLAAHFVEQCLGFLQISGVEALAEPVLDFGEGRACLGFAAGIAS